MPMRHGSWLQGPTAHLTDRVHAAAHVGVAGRNPEGCAHISWGTPVPSSGDSASGPGPPRAWAQLPTPSTPLFTPCPQHLLPTRGSSDRKLEAKKLTTFIINEGINTRKLHTNKVGNRLIKSERWRIQDAYCNFRVAPFINVNDLILKFNS